MKDLELNQVVKLKKPHPCGANLWKIIRLGADIRILCLNCNRSVMIPRVKLERRIKKFLTEEDITKELEKLKDKNDN